MFDDIELTDCPEAYALNCKHYETKCHECKANSTGKYLQYSPIDKTLNAHPCHTKKKKGVTSYSRKGRKVEKKMVLTNPYLIPNYVSGALAGDGDAHIDLPNVGRVRVEIKCRFTKNGNRYPSAKEYRESKTQKIGIIMVNQTQYMNEIYAYINFRLFIRIWRTILWHQDIKWETNKYQYGDIYKFYMLRGVKYGEQVPKEAFFLGEAVNSRTNIFKDDMMRYSRCVVYRNDYGQYVMMHGDTLSNLIDLYKYLTIEE